MQITQQFRKLAEAVLPGLAIALIYTLYAWGIGVSWCVVDSVKLFAPTGPFDDRICHCAHYRTAYWLGSPGELDVPTRHSDRHDVIS